MLGSNLFTNIERLPEPEFIEERELSKRILAARFSPELRRGYPALKLISVDRSKRHKFSEVYKREKSRLFSSGYSFWFVNYRDVSRVESRDVFQVYLLKNLTLHQVRTTYETLMFGFQLLIFSIIMMSLGYLYNISGLSATVGITLGEDFWKIVAIAVVATFASVIYYSVKYYSIMGKLESEIDKAWVWNPKLGTFTDSSELRGESYD